MKYTASIGVLALVMGVSASPLAQFDTELAQVGNSSFFATAAKLTKRAKATKDRVQGALSRIIGKLNAFKKKCKTSSGKCKANFKNIKLGVDAIKKVNDDSKKDENKAVESLRKEAGNDRDALEKKRKEAAKKMQDAIDKNVYDPTQNIKGCSSYKTSPDMFYKCYDSVRCCPGKEMMYLTTGKVQCMPTSYLITANSGYKSCSGTTKIGILTFEQSLHSPTHHEAWKRQALMRRQKNIPILRQRHLEAMKYFQHKRRTDAQLKVLAGAISIRKAADRAVSKAQGVLRKATSWWTKCKNRVPAAEKVLKKAVKTLKTAHAHKKRDVGKADKIIGVLNKQRNVAHAFHKKAMKFTRAADLRRFAAKKSVALALKNRRHFRKIRDQKMKESVQAHKNAANQMQKALNFKH